MKELIITNNGVFRPPVFTPSIVPSFNNGSASATQVGNVVTVTTVNVHNIPLTDIIQQTSPSVYLMFNAGSPIQTGWFTNINIINTYQFSCISLVNQNVSIAQVIISTGSNLIPLIPYSIYLPPNTIQIGSSFKIEVFVEFPSSMPYRAINIVDKFNTYNGWTNALLTGMSFAVSNTSMYYSTLATFLTSTSDSNFQIASSESNNIATYVYSSNNTFNITLNTELYYNLVCNFNNQIANDYIFLSLFLIKLVH